MALPTIFSKEFIKKFFYGKEYNLAFNQYFSKRMKTQKVFYNIYSKKYQDVRDCFLITEEQKKEMADFYNNLVKDFTFNDDKALLIAKWNTEHFKYVNDIVLYLAPEYWANPYMTWKKMMNEEESGDCDDIAILTTYAWGLVGIPAGRRFVRAGNVNDLEGNYAGAHATAVYWSEEYNCLFSLEGTYYAQRSHSNYKNLKFTDDVVYKANTWFWTNEENSYKGDVLKFFN